MKSAALIIAGAVALVISGAEAEEKFLVRIPNSQNVPGVKAIGHSDGTGDSHAENTFGKAFESAGLKWTVALCEADSDGDGQTNGQELGDPCCEWTEGDTPRRTTNISHPSDESKTSNESLWADINCSAVTTSAVSGAGGSLIAQGSVLFASALALGIAAVLNVA